MTPYHNFPNMYDENTWNYADACSNFSEYELSMSTLINNGEGQQKTSDSKNSRYSRGHAQSCMLSLVSVSSIFSSYSLEKSGDRPLTVPAANRREYPSTYPGQLGKASYLSLWVHKVSCTGYVDCHDRPVGCHRWDDCSARSAFIVEVVNNHWLPEVVCG